MKRAIVVGLILAAAMVAWQTTPPAPTWVSVWNGRIGWLRLGPTLSVSNGQIDVALPPVTVRKYRVKLAYDAAAGGWRLPAGAANVAVYCNGLAYDAEDFSIVAGVVVPKVSGATSNMQVDFKVSADYDEAAR